MDQGTLVPTPSGSSVQKIVPLLAELSRVENLFGELAVRIDPITRHEAPGDQLKSDPYTVTARISELGDRLQYLLDHIEL